MQDSTYIKHLLSCVLLRIAASVFAMLVGHIVQALICGTKLLIYYQTESRIYY